MLHRLRAFLIYLTCVFAWAVVHLSVIEWNEVRTVALIEEISLVCVAFCLMGSVFVRSVRNESANKLQQAADAVMRIGGHLLKRFVLAQCFVYEQRNIIERNLQTRNM